MKRDELATGLPDAGDRPIRRVNFRPRRRCRAVRASRANCAECGVVESVQNDPRPRRSRRWSLHRRRRRGSAHSGKPDQRRRRVPRSPATRRHDRRRDSRRSRREDIQGDDAASDRRPLSRWLETCIRRGDTSNVARGRANPGHRRRNRDERLTRRTRLRRTAAHCRLTRHGFRLPDNPCLSLNEPPNRDHHGHEDPNSADRRQDAAPERTPAGRRWRRDGRLRRRP